MSDNAKIEWTDATWNPVTGCSKVSAGCKHCYAERDWARMSANPKTVYYGREFSDVRCHPERLKEGPIRWKKPRRIFVNSMSDLFHPDVPFEFIDEVFEVINCSRMHTFQILTKRPERVLEYFTRPGAWVSEAIADFDHVWLGVTVENQEAADERIPLLLQTPAAVRWVSMEPLLGPVDLVGIFANPNDSRDGTNALEALDWVVVGGESGPRARPMHPGWARSLRDQCTAAGVPFLFKQWGEFVTEYQSGRDTNFCYDNSNAGGWIDFNGASSLGEGAAPQDAMTAEHVFRLGKKAAGRLLDGVLHDGYPEVIPHG